MPGANMSCREERLVQRDRFLDPQLLPLESLYLRSIGRRARHFLVDLPFESGVFGVERADVRGFHEVSLLRSRVSDLAVDSLALGAFPLAKDPS